ncbi:MAG: class II fructose-bisphosphatase [Endozoicomonadaceae bacterium]|nr:class II fructose-bisphosphatase [Endozoicomonadaceae bacterium]MCY4329264.1 class II fructose-bisphosphatase [Endozoicomonadaceae bacterium]
MKHELALEISRMTEAAALAAYNWLGRGNKNRADEAAVETMRAVMNEVNFRGEIVIGEGEIDEAPMLYIGEKVGSGQGAEVDIAVDPIDGTRMTAMGQNNAVSVIAVSEKGGLLKAPDMYMEKLAVGPQAKGVIDLNLPLLDNLKAIAKELDKSLNKLTVVTLAKPRHSEMIRQMQSAGIKVFALPDGDVAASVLTCIPESEVDVMYCIGGAPEGVISAAVIRALRGDLHGRLMLRTEAKGDTPENRKAADKEQSRCAEMGVTPGKIFPLPELVKTDNVLFSATGITKGDLLEGVVRKGMMATTETLLIRGKSRTIRRINSTHYLERKSKKLHKHIL